MSPYDRWIATVCLLTFVQANSIASQLPQKGLAAEQLGQWDQAIEIYKNAFKKNPNNHSLWPRIADIYESQGDNKLLIAALEQMVKHSPDEPATHFRLAQSYSVANRLELALTSCRRAVALDPENLTYRHALSQLAGWTGDHAIAKENYEYLLDKNPDPKWHLELGRIKSWQGDLDDAIVDFEHFLAAYPDDQPALLELIKNEAWRGNYARAIHLLEHFKTVDGDLFAYQREKARVLAWAGRPKDSLRLLTPLLSNQPNAFHELFTWTLALGKMRQQEQALALLSKLEKMAPEAKEVVDLGLSTRLPYRSRLSAEYSTYLDSDHIDIHHLTIQGRWQKNLNTRLLARLRTRHLAGQLNSGLEPINGGSTIQETNFSLGFTHYLDPDREIGAWLGYESIDRANRFTTFELFAHWWPSDEITLRASTVRDLWAVSPRSVSLGIYYDRYRATIAWRPDLRNTFNIDTKIDRLSDHNTSRSLALSWSFNTVRREKINLDLGLSGWWLSYNKNLTHGYYDPANYRLYQVNAQIYRKISDDHGISLNIAYGLQKDETFNRYEPAYDGSIEGVFGIFKDWHLRVRVAHTKRHQNTGAFDANSLSCFFERRF